jgi:glycosyltransferase involved in cell wall biosynthesis
MSLEHVDIFVTDSQFHKDEVHEIYGVELEKIIELPLKISDDLQQKTSLPKRRILFANRISREKQPQMAISVAALLEDAGINIDIFGAKDEVYCAEIIFDTLVENASNVDYKGLFSTSEELAFDNYDICFMPSLYEGTPRIVLESIKAGLFIVCSDVGGMPESVVSGVSGVVLPRGSSAQRYADAILNYYHTPALQNLTKRKIANSAVIKKHSDEAYINIVRSIYKLEKKDTYAN